MNRARFIATIGPASFNYDTMMKMVDLGVASFRINTAHIETGYISKVREILEEMKDCGVSPSIMVDLKGPEIRMLTPDSSEVSINEGQNYEIFEGRSGVLSLNQKGIIDDITPGDSILVNDGRVKFSVISKDSSSIKVQALNDGNIRNNSRVNVPGKVLNLGSLTDRDRLFVLEGIKNEVEYFALSFVQEKRNVEELYNLILEEGGDQFIISKIETLSGVNNIEEILKASDMIMIARGDLGVELPLREVTMIQKRIIKKAHSYGIPTIVATQILESMVLNETPTRAEVSDITNAIIDNADILMLSEETAIGKYPVNAVSYLNEVVSYVESCISKFEEPAEFLGNKIAFSLAKSAKIISDDIDSDILVLTKSGNTVKMISALRPKGKIFVITPKERLSRKLGLFNNVYPIKLSDYSGNYEDIIKRVRDADIFNKGKVLVVTSGEGYFTFGGTNDIRVEIMGDFTGRGYPAGESISGRVTNDQRGEGDILITDKCNDIEDINKFKGVIFKCNPTDSLIKDMLKKVRCIVKLASFREDVKDGEIIYIDARTGIIYK